MFKPTPHGLLKKLYTPKGQTLGLVNYWGIEMTALEERRFCRLPDVLKLTGMSRSTIYVWISEGHFPKPYRLGLRAVGWLESDVAEWLDSRPLSGESHIELIGTHGG